MPHPPTRRICLLAGYDRHGTVPDYVVLLARGLATVADVFFFSDNDLPEAECAKLAGIATVCGHQRHGRYDFGSWATLIDHLGWERIGGYDELILANDSCYGPVADLRAICDRMSASDCDFWGLTGSPEIAFHIQSYFAVFKRPVLEDPAFRRFWQTVEREDTYEDIVRKYEVGLTQLLLARGFRPATWLPSDLGENLTIFPLTLLERHAMPLVKVKCFSDPYLGSREKVSLLFRHLKRHAPDIAGAIARHQGAGFLAKAMQVQRREPPVFYRKGPIRIRSIRGCRLKITFRGKWRVILPLSPAMMRRLSRLAIRRVRI